VGGGLQLGLLGTAATNALLCQPQVIMMMEKLVKSLAGETEVFGENLPQCRFVHHKPPHAARTWTWAAVVGSQWLTAWAMAWPGDPINFNSCCHVVCHVSAANYISLFVKIKPRAWPQTVLTGFFKENQKLEYLFTTNSRLWVLLEMNL
jgi:hypothetical protein